MVDTNTVTQKMSRICCGNPLYFVRFDVDASKIAKPCVLDAEQKLDCVVNIEINNKKS